MRFVRFVLMLRATLVTLITKSKTTDPLSSIVAKETIKRKTKQYKLFSFILLQIAATARQSINY